MRLSTACQILVKVKEGKVANMELINPRREQAEEGFLVRKPNASWRDWVNE
jgi:hypothetical protein